MIIDFAKYSSVKIGAKLDVAVLSQTAASELYLIGQASNLLINRSSNLAVLHDKFAYIKECGDYLEVGAKTPAYKLFSFCKRHDLGGLEFLAHLPGQMGGIVKMNAGMKDDEIKQYILEVNIDGRWQLPHFGYRTSDIRGHIFAVRLRLLRGFCAKRLELFKAMRSNQPKGASFGSIFKNPTGKSAGALIDAAGLKGTIRGGAMISDVHANFLINFNNASFSDALYLINLAQERVFKMHGIALEPEVIIIDEKEF